MGRWGKVSEETENMLKTELTQLSNEFGLIEPDLKIKGSRQHRAIYRYAKRQIIIRGMWVNAYYVLNHEFWHYIQHYLNDWDISVFAYIRFTRHGKRECEVEAKRFGHLKAKIRELKSLLHETDNPTYRKPDNPEYKKNLTLRIYRLKEELQPFIDKVKSKSLNSSSTEVENKMVG